jgi:hypothetical protein
MPVHYAEVPAVLCVADAIALVAAAVARGGGAGYITMIPRPGWRPSSCGPSLREPLVQAFRHISDPIRSG